MRRKTPSDFGLVLRELREAHQKTAADLARALGVASQLISNVEAGHKPLLAAEQLKHVRKALHLTAIEYAKLRRARIMTLLDLALGAELSSQPLAKMKAIIALSRPATRRRL